LSNATKELGRTIGQIQKDQSTTNENITGDDSDAELQVASSEQVILGGRLDVYRLDYPDNDSFILDHPVYCNLDSSILKIDGGYALSFVIDHPIYSQLDVDEYILDGGYSQAGGRTLLYSVGF